MRFSDLVVSQKDFNLKKTDILIVIPFYRNYDALFRHLGLLSRQTLQDFNAILVLNSVSDEKRIVDFILENDFGFGIVVAKRKEDTGSAGGFFTGEKYALENGYDMIVLADDDCMPEDDGLLAQLTEHAEKHGLAAANVRIVVTDRDTRKGGSIHMYGALEAGLIKKTGLHFMPLYIGGDDSEFALRLSIVSRLSLVPQVQEEASHPYSNALFMDFRRSLLYRINHMLFWGLTWSPMRIFDYIQNFAVFCLAYVLFGTPVVRKGGIHILSSVLSFKYGKSVLDSFRDDVRFAEPPRSAKRFSFKDRPSVWGVLRKEALLDPLPNDSILLSMVFAKETWISTKKGAYLMAENRNVLIHLLKLTVFLAAAPLFALAGLISIPFGLLRKPKTMGYGLD